MIRFFFINVKAFNCMIRILYKCKTLPGIMKIEKIVWFDSNIYLQNIGIFYTRFRIFPNFFRLFQSNSYSTKKQKSITYSHHAVPLESYLHLSTMRITIGSCAMLKLTTQPLATSRFPAYY